MSGKVYKKVLHTGDSMVGGGLARALRPKFEAEGAKYIRDVWESGSLRDFARSDRIPNLLKTHHPDLVVLTLGANDVYEKDPEVVAPFIEKIAKMTTGTDCLWIGPPFWKKEHERMVDTFKKHVAPCEFFDSSGIEMQRKKDGIHPDEKGGEQWADAIWSAVRGNGGAPASR
jgi:lysophospholipase L1-like esterase